MESSASVASSVNGANSGNRHCLCVRHLLYSAFFSVRSLFPSWLLMSQEPPICLSSFYLNGMMSLWQCEEEKANLCPQLSYEPALF